MLHQQGEAQQVVDSLLNDPVLHGLGYLLGRLVREPAVGAPRVGCPDLELALAGFGTQEVP